MDVTPDLEIVARLKVSLVHISAVSALRFERVVDNTVGLIDLTGSLMNACHFVPASGLEFLEEHVRLEQAACSLFDDSVIDLLRFDDCVTEYVSKVTSRSCRFAILGSRGPILTSCVLLATFAVAALLFLGSAIFTFDVRTRGAVSSTSGVLGFRWGFPSCIALFAALLVTWSA